MESKLPDSPSSTRSAPPDPTSGRIGLKATFALIVAAFGPGAFVLQILTFDTFADAMSNKLLTEISSAPTNSLPASAP